MYISIYIYIMYIYIHIHRILHTHVCIHKNVRCLWNTYTLRRGRSLRFTYLFDGTRCLTRIASYGVAMGRSLPKFNLFWKGALFACGSLVKETKELREVTHCCHDIGALPDSIHYHSATSLPHQVNFILHKTVRCLLQKSPIQRGAVNTHNSLANCPHISTLFSPLPSLYPWPLYACIHTWRWW